MLRSWICRTFVTCLAASTIGHSAQASTSSELIDYVAQTDSLYRCSEGVVGSRQFVHCRSSTDCSVPNLLFEIRGSVAVWANGKAGTFIEKHPRPPVKVVDGRPLPYTAGDVMKALGCP